MVNYDDQVVLLFTFVNLILIDIVLEVRFVLILRAVGLVNFLFDGTWRHKLLMFVAVVAAARHDSN